MSNIIFLQFGQYCDCNLNFPIEYCTLPILPFPASLSARPNLSPYASQYTRLRPSPDISPAIISCSQNGHFICFPPNKNYQMSAEPNISATKILEKLSINLSSKAISACSPLAIFLSFAVPLSSSLSPSTITNAAPILLAYFICGLIPRFMVSNSAR